MSKVLVNDSLDFVALGSQLVCLFKLGESKVKDQRDQLDCNSLILGQDLLDVLPEHDVDLRRCVEEHVSKPVIGKVVPLEPLLPCHLLIDLL